MSVKRTIIRNVLSNWAGYGVSIAVAIFLSPFVVHSLGDGAYGMWTLLVSLTGYYGLLDLGIRSGVGQYVTRYWAQGDMDGVNRTMNTALVVLTGIAAVAIIATCVIAWMLPQWFTAEDIPASDLQLAMLIMGVGFSLTLPMMVFGTATTARQRFDVAHGIGISTRLVGAAAVIIALRSGYGLVGLAAVDACIKIGGYVIRWIVAYRMLPGLTISLRLASRASFREIGHYSGYSFIIRASGRIIFYTDTLVIGVAMTAGAVTYYAIGGNLIPYFMGLVSSITLAFTPYATSCDANSDRNALRRLLLVGTRGSSLFAALIGGGMFFFGTEFIALWMGQKYVLGKPFASSGHILMILVAASMFRAVHNTGLQVLLGMRKVRFLAILSGGEAVANLGLSLVLVRYMGIMGVAIGTLIPIVIARGVVQPLYLLREFKLSPLALLRESALGSGTVIVLLGVGSWSLRQVLPATNWGMFFLKVAIIAVPSGLAGLFVGMAKSKKGAIAAMVTSRLARSRDSKPNRFCDRGRPEGGE